ncbi:hypothetical protein KVR01_005578 [Diaporthe batatas]|uniref:uncharacterized protein n=1 Tax=Diaporthe batatas TaxID=748121 RepID=UPI001D043891|nr:uncharacterized protein KVR01_005578 [Diaporthe batatas]KAG8165303.1 hypothetical protein KVR01_005578 [Diaporthe batatas]
MTDAPMTKTDPEAEEHYTRLHIAPLNPELLKVIVPQAVLPKAREISYHTLQAFPERPYGFIEIPSAAAQKIKSKLNGAVLKGVKIRVEPARPDNMPKPDPDAIISTAAGGDLERKSKKSKTEKREKKRKRDPQEIAGIELEEGRKIKRGWTVTPDEAKAKKKKEKEREKAKSKSGKDKKEKEGKDKKDKKKRRRDAESEYTDGPECLVKTQLPPNKRDTVAGDSQGEAKKSKKHKTHEVVVHEFKNTTKFPTYFKASKGATTSGTGYEFVEGKGWVDSDGNVVENIKSTRPKGLPTTLVERKTSKDDEDEDDTTSSSGSSSEEEGEDSEAEDDNIAAKKERKAAHPALKSLAIDVATSTGSESPQDSARPKSSSSARSLTIKIPPATPSSNKIHPLEALYKRQQQDKAEDKADTTADQPFSFFSGQDLEEEDDNDLGQGEGVGGSGIDNDENSSQAGPSQGSQLPMTPFSKQDFEWRGMRSAAPTPDTAHPSRYSRIWPLRDDREESPGIPEGEEYHDQSNSPMGASQANDEEGEQTNPSTDFQKWFYENRGDLNRSWAKRRKTAAKQKRYRENKARAA